MCRVFGFVFAVVVLLRVTVGLQRFWRRVRAGRQLASLRARQLEALRRRVAEREREQYALPTSASGRAALLRPVFTAWDDLATMAFLKREKLAMARWHNRQSAASAAFALWYGLQRPILLSHTLQ